MDSGRRAIAMEVQARVHMLAQEQVVPVMQLPLVQLAIQLGIHVRTLSPAPRSSGMPRYLSLSKHERTCGFAPRANHGANGWRQK